MAFAADKHRLLAHTRIIASCRTETWRHFTQSAGPKPLDRALFYPGNGDALLVSGFENNEDRENLYASYQQAYSLEPRKYAELDQSVQALIRQPLLMP